MYCIRVKIFELLELLDIVGFIVGMFLWVLFMGPSGHFTHVVVILDCLGQVYAGVVFV